MPLSLQVVKFLLLLYSFYNTEPAKSYNITDDILHYSVTYLVVVFGNIGMESLSYVFDKTGMELFERGAYDS